jgi:hypothetical protein
MTLTNRPNTGLLDSPFRYASESSRSIYSESMHEALSFELAKGVTKYILKHALTVDDTRDS